MCSCFIIFVYFCCVVSLRSIALTFINFDKREMNAAFIMMNSTMVHPPDRRRAYIHSTTYIRQEKQRKGYLPTTAGLIHQQHPAMQAVTPDIAHFMSNSMNQNVKNQHDAGTKTTDLFKKKIRIMLPFNCRMSIPVNPIKSLIS